MTESPAHPSTETRIVIVDPVCAKRTGHNLPTLSKYKSFFESRGLRVEAMHVAASFATPPPNCIADLTFNYSPFLAAESMTRRLIRQQKWSRGFGPGALREVTRFFLAYPLLHRSAAAAAIDDMAALIDRYPQSTFFYPGADFYVVWAAKELARRRALKDARFVFRLMGVMETAAFLPVPDRVLPWLLRDLALAAPGAVTFTAETEKYARRIESWTQTRVPTTHIPSFDAARISAASEKERPPVSPSRPLVLGFLGGARADKGYGDIMEMAHQLYARFGLSIVCKVQTMRPDEQYYSRDSNLALAKWPNVHMLPSTLSEEQLVRTISSCDALVLPYSVGTYQWRGSAMLFDALSLGLPVFGKRGTAFGESIESYGLGYTFADNLEFTSKVNEFKDSLDSNVARLHWVTTGSRYLESLEKNLCDCVSAHEEVVYLH